LLDAVDFGKNAAAVGLAVEATLADTLHTIVVRVPQIVVHERKAGSARSLHTFFLHEVVLLEW